MENSHIEWTDHTFNPWIGCTKVSPGCTHCYAEALNKRWKQGKNWGKGAPRDRTSEAYWKKPLEWNTTTICDVCGEVAEETVICCGKPTRRPRVFCASLADWLDEEAKIEDLADLLKLIHATPNLDWLLLTKRPENWYERVRDALAHIEGIDPIDGWDSVDSLSEVGYWINDWLGEEETPANIRIGTTVENQAMADERISLLLSIPAKVRFLSLEPLLESVNLGFDNDNYEPFKSKGKIDWVICGGESGSGARPMHPDWARSLRDQCTAAGVPFFFKQWGEWGPYGRGGIDPKQLVSAGALDYPLGKFGKKRSGRLLDGREWNEVPK